MATRSFLPKLLAELRASIKAFPEGFYDSFVERNYREALLHLEARRKIGVEPPADVRGTRSGRQVWGSGTRASFPR